MFLVCFIGNFVSAVDAPENLVNCLSDKPNVGVLIIRSEKGYHNSWRYLVPLIELFQNDDIKAIVLLMHVDGGRFGTPPAFGLARSIKILKQIYNKPVIAYGETWLTSSAYIIATAADYIMASPGCLVGYMGYYANYEDKNLKNERDGISVTPIHAGKYKFFMDSDQPISKDDLAKVHDHFEIGWQNVIEELVQLRPSLNANRDKWINGEIFTASQEPFFVDKIGDKIDLDRFVASLIGYDGKSKFLVKERYADLEKIDVNQDAKAKIVVLNVLGFMSWEDTGRYFDVLLKTFDDKDVLGVIININCYGASSALSGNIHTEIKKLKQMHSLPVVAYVDRDSLSGGYELACAADYIISSPLAEIGSVGVRWPRQDNTKKDPFKNSRYHNISANKFGSILDEYSVLTQKGAALLQATVDATYACFVQHVKEARPQMVHNETEWKEAQIYHAYKALDLGMVDALGCPIDAVRYIEKNKNLNDIKFVFYDLIKPKDDKK